MKTDNPTETPPELPTPNSQLPAATPPPAAEVVATGTRTEIPAKTKHAVTVQAPVTVPAAPKKKRGGWFFFNANEGED